MVCFFLLHLHLKHALTHEPLNIFAAWMVFHQLWVSNVKSTPKILVLPLSLSFPPFSTNYLFSHFCSALNAWEWKTFVCQSSEIDGYPSVSNYLLYCTFSVINLSLEPKYKKMAVFTFHDIWYFILDVKCCNRWKVGILLQGA